MLSLGSELSTLYLKENLDFQPDLVKQAQK